jgi:hypothetical protein
MAKKHPFFPALPEKFRFKTVHYQLYEINIVEGYCKVAGKDKKFNTFEEAYDYIEREINGLPVFDSKSISEFYPAYSGGMSGMLVNRETNRLFMSRGDASLWDLDLQYKYFKKLAKKYFKDRKNFYNAYHFLAQHPVFWSLHGELPQSKMLFWETDYGFDKMWHTVYRDRTGKVIHLLEHGPYMDSEEEITGVKQIIPCRIPSHDIRLDVIGNTYEEAIIKLAKRVHKFYDLNGEER